MIGISFNVLGVICLPYKRITGAAPLSDEVNEMLFKLFPDAHIGQAYGGPAKDTVTISSFIYFPPRHDRDLHCDEFVGYRAQERRLRWSVWPFSACFGYAYDHFAGAGRLLPGVVARVVKSDGTLGGYDEVGELVVKAPSNTLGYYNNAQACV